MKKLSYPTNFVTCEVEQSEKWKLSIILVEQQKSEVVDHVKSPEYITLLLRKYWTLSTINKGRIKRFA